MCAAQAVARCIGVRHDGGLLHAQRASLAQEEKGTKLENKALLLALNEAFAYFSGMY